MPTQPRPNVLSWATIVDQVMADSKDLVEVVHTLRQVANYKGL